MRKFLAGMFIIAVIMILFNSCTAKKVDIPDEEDEENNIIDEPLNNDETQIPEQEDTRPINPLTGLHTDYDVDKKTVAIMINNIKSSLPQSGISEADVIYEALAEGNITRLLALYLDASHIDNIGSIRSTRLYYLKLALGHNSLLIHAGQSAETKKYLKDNNIFTLDAGGSRGTYFYRDKDRRKKGYAYEHTLFITGESLATMLGSVNQDQLIADETITHFDFSDKEFIPEGKDANEVNVFYISSFYGNFKYDVQTGLYTKYQYEQEHMDELYNVPITVKNVFVLHCDMNVIPGDECGRHSLDFSKGGTGYYISNGKAVNINWIKESDYEPIRYFYSENMVPLKINKGKSYICIVNKSAAVTLKS